MNFGGIGGGELLVILLIALIVFGPGRLTEIASSLGKALREFRKMSQDLTTEIQKELEVTKELQAELQKEVGVTKELQAELQKEFQPLRGEEAKEELHKEPQPSTSEEAKKEPPTESPENEPSTKEE